MNILLAQADIGGFLDDVGPEAGLASATGDPNVALLPLIGDIIGIVLGLLGVVFLFLTIYAGIIWMTAQGNEEKVEKAIGIMKTATIGLIVTLAAYSISAFIVDQVGTSTGTSSTTEGGAQ